LKLSLIVARSENNVIGNGADIPWKAEGEQLLFKAMTYNQWLLVGRRTFQSIGTLPNRKYAVVSRSGTIKEDEHVKVFTSVEHALSEMPQFAENLIVSGGGQIYRSTIGLVDTIHMSTIHINVVGDVYFPEIPAYFEPVFTQYFKSNIDYTYEILQRA
jgi:dihydrofolate reductase (trimethoprim resistance protein)